ncbi:MAG: hypothetical protein P8Y29_06940, partial [Gemmatimonadota bacterium]
RVFGDPQPFVQFSKRDAYILHGCFSCLAFWTRMLYEKVTGADIAGSLAPVEERCRLLKTTLFGELRDGKSKDKA